MVDFRDYTYIRFSSPSLSKREVCYENDNNQTDIEVVPEQIESVNPCDEDVNNKEDIKYEDVNNKEEDIKYYSFIQEQRNPSRWRTFWRKICCRPTVYNISSSDSPSPRLSRKVTFLLVLVICLLVATTLGIYTLFIRLHSPMITTEELKNNTEASITTEAADTSTFDLLSTTVTEASLFENSTGYDHTTGYNLTTMMLTMNDFDNQDSTLLTPISTVTSSESTTPLPTTRTRSSTTTTSAPACYTLGGQKCVFPMMYSGLPFSL